MARLILDHNVAHDTAVFLNAMGHDVSTAQQEGRPRAPDEEHLLMAAHQDRVFVTHDAEDFALLHDAWRRWSAAWGVNPRHSGILVIPQWPADRIAREVAALLQEGFLLSNELYQWKSSQGWVRRP